MAAFPYPTPSVLSRLHTGATQYPGSTDFANDQTTGLGSPSTTPAASSGRSSSCEHCHMKPKYCDGVKIYPYCSKSCASNAKVNGHRKLYKRRHDRVSVASGTCDFCHRRPKSPGNAFCSEACAEDAISSTHLAGNLNATGTCLAPGCSNRAHFNFKKLTYGDYCSLSHKTLGETLCLMCLQNARQTNSHFCSKRCADNAEVNGPMLLEVPAGHVTFENVSDRFKASWQHPGTTCPSVKYIYKIVSPKLSLAAYNRYKAAVEARLGGKLRPAGRSAGNENRRWHGTTRECHLGDNGQTQFCGSKTCSLCCIVKTSFDLSLFGKKTGWGRFGRGIYTTSTSSKANDYSDNKSPSSLRAILLNQVVVGKQYKLLYNNVTLTKPPPGYDSVLGEKGGSLNYDELVVYTNDAIRPSFLVMYEV
ncbi:ADP-ribosylation [Gymnopus androsaceus JB14]|uniref:ADP-ribosylation n=1 Tax=Gymnopus androsaceus JB14 TaxID=1447944 RepID=A0A6A4GNW1_9AGAR|nr:ADP-ribosylation [Gymnopus androsaceus JB14]